MREDLKRVMLLLFLAFVAAGWVLVNDNFRAGVIYLILALGGIFVYNNWRS